MSGFLALVSGTVGKIGYDLMLMMQSETTEVLEPFVAGRGASSTMPQKRNPISSEIMLASAKIVREQHSAMLDAMVQDHERATGQWHVEWHALPTAFIVASGGLSAAIEALEGLEVRPQAMAKTLNTTRGLIVAEAVMMSLAPRLGRQRAHDLVYDCCRTALSTGEEFNAVLLKEPEIANAFQSNEIEVLTNPQNRLSAAIEALEGLEVRPQAMAKTLNTTRGLIVAEAVMMSLAPRLGRQRAHDLVYDCCRTALSTGEEFNAVLLKEPEIANAFQSNEIEVLTNPQNHLGAAPEMARTLLARRQAENLKIRTTQAIGTRP